VSAMVTALETASLAILGCTPPTQSFRFHTDGEPRLGSNTPACSQ
jgi:hypothetical protein